MGIPRLHSMSEAPRRPPLRVAPDPPPAPTFASVYREHAAFVRRSVRHLDVPDAAADDVLHDVFLIVHRRLADFDARTSMRAWLFGIARRVAMHHRRGRLRRSRREQAAPVPAATPCPEHVAASREAARWVEGFLAGLDPSQRAVFMLCEIEGLAAPEVAAATGTKLNTVYSRLRLARRRFERAVDEREKESR
ncbi:MAG: RNA polymerase sigma factor [Nannocystaceae bacterium]|nr:sigma-70 family RNA polymerase sigma factor [bacterium]